MAATAMLDLRRTDLRTNVLENPYWITSGEITPACDDKVGVLFSFPISHVAGSICPAFYGNTIIIIQEMVMEVETAFTGPGTEVFTLGTCTLATQAEATTTTADDPTTFIESFAGSGVNMGVAGLYPLHATSGYNTTRLLGQHAVDYVIIPTNTVVLCVACYLSSDAAITTGSAFLHMLIAMPPVVS
jgi:hypothetical protein